MIIQRTGMRQMKEELKMPRRVIHEELGVPVPAAGPPEKQAVIDEESLLKVLAEDYRTNPGLHMSREDLMSHFELEDEKLDQVLRALEEQGYAKLHRDKKGIALAKATYKGLNKAFPLDHYKWFPSWVNEERIF